MKNRSIILTAMLSLLGCGGLSCTALAGANVSVVNTPNVNVVNTTTNPVPISGTVQNADALNAVQSSVLLEFTATNLVSESITIPAGKIFVLEFVSFNSAIQTGFTVQSIAITVTGNLVQGGQGSALYKLLIPPPSFSGSQVMRLYAQPGTNLVIEGQLSGVPSLPASITVSVSGYFVDAQ